MQGCGNDFMVVDLVSQYIKIKPEMVQRWADRHFGIGFDQLLTVEPPLSPDADFRYRIFNADGGEVEQCGNGARCFALFVHDKNLSRKKTLLVETKGRRIELTILDNKDVTVDMGVPRFEPSEIPFLASAHEESYLLELADEPIRVSLVSMGNPHAISIVNNVESTPVTELGAMIERHERFPERVNAGFMQIVDRQNISVRVFERGVGETLACGTGACAAAVVGIKKGLLDKRVNVSLQGGQLQISWDGIGNTVKMTGPCSKVYEGRIFV